MRHGAAVKAFPPPTEGEIFEGDVHGFCFGERGAATHIAILPDIYRCNGLYRGLSQRFTQKGARVTLVDPFRGLGELSAVTREAAFARCRNVRDAAFIDHLEGAALREHVSGVLGFCLGGPYVFELARRGLPLALIGLYGFPHGMANSDPLPVPSDYLEKVSRSFTMLMGSQDASVGPDTVSRLKVMSPCIPALKSRVYENVGHGFLPMVDSENPEERGVAIDALKHIDEGLFRSADGTASRGVA